MKLFKNLFSRRSRGDEALTNSPSDSPEGCGKLAGDNIPGERPHLTPHPEGVQENFDSTSSIPLDPNNKRNGKIAKLPRHIRDHINRAFDSGQSAVSIAEHLNKLPEVKAILDTHFEGRPIRHQNLSEWKAGGYRDWQLRQELLYKQQELAADASEMGKIAHGMDDSLFGMALLDYARLMKCADKDTPEEFEKKRKALSNMINDVVRLRRCQNQTRGVEVQEERLERDREKTAEEMFQKFMEWASNPEIRRTFILEPIVAMALQRRHFGLPPRPEDAAVLKEYGYADPAETGENQEVPTDFPPPPTKNSETGRSRGDETLTKKETLEPEPVESMPHTCVPCAPSSTPPTSEDASPRPSILDATRNTQHVGPIRPISPMASTPEPTSEAVTPNSSIEKGYPIAPGSPVGCGTLAGDNIPGERTPMTPRPEGAPENPASTLLPGVAFAKTGQPLDTLAAPKPSEGGSTSPQAPVPEPERDLVAELYAALRPTPELLEERNRKHEELRRQAEANRQVRLIQSQPGIQSSSPLDSFSEPGYPHAPKPPQPGFAPPPAVPFPVHSIFGEIHHPSDNWKCHPS